ncbi:MAG: glycoside hydrolase family 2 TIM barrel-domain containing protein [Firmicutes bacterium]|nr:glycoside hydrolase family 2 TIM barrel-domain containing protein [Bacillota bacterium]
MRTILNLNHKWAFAKGVTEAPAEIPKLWDFVNLPHTWNAIDGQDGGGDYFRGTCCYAKTFSKMDLPAAERYYLEILGANSSADVVLNGKHLAHHDGGYSTWRVDVTDALQEDNLLAILVDNAPNETVYPQMADFTFYGGLYRDVNLLCVPQSHFDLDYFGGPGIQITPVMEEEDAKVAVSVFVTDQKPGQTLRYQLFNAEGKAVGTYEGEGNKVNFRIKNAHLWNGRKDPYLYSCKVELLENGEVLDAVSARFGCRSFSIDPERGFILNGEEYPLRGVSRHQDRWGVGNALLPEHHREDMDLICEMGANTIRLAHYQHDQYFYDLCDERGIVVWAEIPYISRHMPTGRENTIQQMTELITQNFNHPSIVVWGLSNEITMQGAEDPDLLENHRILNDLCHKMDPTRLTTMACVSPCPMDAKILQIPDVVSYNHYFGWYGGDTSMNGPWFDKFHEKHPDLPVGCSEYGCEALNWHTSDPQQGDYTEEYQAHYHEELIKQLFPRKYIWATHVWNMFDFGCDARNEGGENGQNHKGLVTIDRKYKKDAFYAYKAWLSDEPFVHLCGKRYVDRVEDVTKVTVYSNQPTVELFANGTSLGVQEAPDHFFYFEVPNAGQTHLVAVAGDCRDESVIRKVETFNESYRLREKGAVLNWFDITEVEGHLSLNSKFGDIMGTLQGKMLLMSLMTKKMPKGGKKGGGFDMSSLGGMMDMLSGFTLLRLTGMMGTMNVTFTKEELLDINAKLNKIKAPKK